MFNVVLGCKHAPSHINPFAGIFGVLEERLKKLERVEPIPARESVACPHRRTAQCNQDCPKAVYGIMSTGKISWQNIGATL